MKNNTLVRIKVPKALYESALEKALLEAAGKDPKKEAAEKKVKAKKSIKEAISGTEEELKAFYEKVKQIEAEGTDIDSAIQHALFDMTNPEAAAELSMREVKTLKKEMSHKKLTNELSIDGTMGPTPDEIKLTYQIAAGIIGGFSLAGALIALKNLKDKAKATPQVLKMVAKDVLKKGAKVEDVAKATGLPAAEIQKVAGQEEKMSEMKAHKMMHKK